MVDSDRLGSDRILVYHARIDSDWLAEYPSQSESTTKTHSDESFDIKSCIGTIGTNDGFSGFWAKKR